MPSRAPRLRSRPVSWKSWKRKSLDMGTKSQIATWLPAIEIELAVLPVPAPVAQIREPAGYGCGNGGQAIPRIWNAARDPPTAALALFLPDQSQARSTPHASKTAAVAGETGQIPHNRQRSSLPPLSEPGGRSGGFLTGAGLDLRYHIHSAGSEIFLPGDHAGCLHARHPRLEPEPQSGYGSDPGGAAAPLEFVHH